MLTALCEHVIAAACGQSGKMAAVTRSGKLFTLRARGADTTFEASTSPAGEHFVAVGAGNVHMAAVTQSGRLFTWGNGAWGKLGHGDGERSEEAPKQVAALADEHVVAVAGGNGHTAAVTRSGRLYTWGLGDSGELGHGTSMQDWEHGSGQLMPKPVDALSDEHVVSVAAGLAHTAVVTATGTLFVMGNSPLLPDPASVFVPCAVQTLLGEHVIAASICSLDADTGGGCRTVAATRSGMLFTWGRAGGGGMHAGEDTFGAVRSTCALAGPLGLGDTQDQVIPQWVEAVQLLE